MTKRQFEAGRSVTRWEMAGNAEKSRDIANLLGIK